MFFVSLDDTYSFTNTILQVAIIYEADEPNQAVEITYSQLLNQVCQLANALKTMGVKKGDTVIVYLPMIAEAAVALLACARIGAVHSVVLLVSVQIHFVTEQMIVKLES
jgi:acetyl-CoA synthetase